MLLQHPALLPHHAAAGQLLAAAHAPASRRNLAPIYGRWHPPVLGMLPNAPLLPPASPPAVGWCIPPIAVALGGSYFARLLHQSPDMQARWRTLRLC